MSVVDMSKTEIINELRRRKPELSEKFHLQKLGIFGSVARDDGKKFEDLDVVVELSTTNIFDLIGVKQDLEDQFHVKVDIVRLREQMNPFLKKRIEEDAIYV